MLIIEVLLNGRQSQSTDSLINPKKVKIELTNYWFAILNGGDAIE
jgi:hypothetical protein